MISNITHCCRNCLTPNETLYVEVRNQCHYYLYINIEYRLNDKIYKKQSPVFQPGKFQRLTFPSYAVPVYLRIFNCEATPPDIVCGLYIKDYISSCYRVTGQSIGDILCVEIPC